MPSARKSSQKNAQVKKRAATGFSLFFQMKRKAMLKKFPDQNAMKSASIEWRKLSKKQKEKYASTVSTASKKSSAKSAKSAKSTRRRKVIRGRGDGDDDETESDDNNDTSNTTDANMSTMVDDSDE